MKASNLSVTKKVSALVGLLFLFVGLSGYCLMVHHEHEIIESQARSIAEIVSRQAGAARATYVQDILDKAEKDGVAYPHPDYESIKGALPIPSQFLKEMAKKASKSSQGMYKYRAISKWNLGENQGLGNDFLKSAWLDLEKQDQDKPQKPIDWKPVYSLQKHEGEYTFLYLKAVPASHAVCVDCHNKMSPTSHQKTWTKDQLLGGLFVEVPVGSMMAAASKQSRFVIFWILGVLTVGLGLLAFTFSRDLVKAKKIKARLLWQTKHDTLTSLPNRISFDYKAAKLISNAEKTNQTHALFLLDLDHFKLVNDACGHEVGDELLLDISQVLRANLPDDALLARLGGDEFGVLIENCTLEQATEAAQQLCETVKAYQFSKGEHSFDIGASIGVVLIDSASGNIKNLTRSADLACYAAKDAGKNRVHVFKDDDAELNLKAAEVSWASEISRALEENRIVIYSQRIGSVTSSTQHVHHEILVRLIDREGNIVLPDNFIPAAERYKMMPRLDMEIIERSLSALSSGYFKDLGTNGFISINLSGQSFGEEDFLGKVKGLMDKYQVDPEQVCFEITESAAIANRVLVKEFMSGMKELGVKFALDDFGTGLSSLTYLKQFPVDYLKIDGSFIKDIMTDDIDRTLVDAINQMAHTMGLKTIAEYVESKEIFSLLGTINIDYAQGYYIQKPTLVDSPSQSRD